MKLETTKQHRKPRDKSDMGGGGEIISTMEGHKL